MELTINSELLSTLFDSVSELLTTPEIFTIVVATIILFISKSYLGAKENKSLMISSFEIALYIVLGIVIISNVVLYVFGIEIGTNIQNLFSSNPLLEIEINTKKDKEKTGKKVEFSDKEEVYHVSGNKYTYEDAAPICKVLGGRVATYDDIEKAYENGGEWCEYGWSDGQMAYFPTQKKSWNSLQNTENKHACGRPGINGGYIDNPNVRFGVNCYGVKPDMSETEKWTMENTSIVSSSKDTETSERKDYWESKIEDLLVSPFNQNKWNKI